MSADSTDDEMHLTPDGWVNGTHFFYSEPEKIIPRPANAVETWNRQMRQSSSFSKEHVEWNCLDITRLFKN